MFGGGGAGGFPGLIWVAAGGLGAMLLGHGTAGPLSKLGAVRPPGPYLANSSGVGGGGFPCDGFQPGGYGGGSLMLEAG